jgi:serine/threonine protein kinase/Tol biopolymer transport system component
MIGSTVGHYEILEKLGEGGMGVVYKARDVLLNRTVALKFLPADDSAADEKRRRFIQEAQSASALNHPNIITIYEVAKDGDLDFIAMEFVQGQTLDQLIAKKALTIDATLSYAIQVADALAAAHAAGIVHRDLKPGNVMVSDSGLVKVLDFGLAKLVGGPAGASGETETVFGQSPKTVPGMIVGTIAYMSPEQAEGKPVDHRSDIFSFGAMLHEMLTGHRAFQGESTASTLAALLTAEPKALSIEAPAAPAELTRIVSRCLRKSPAKRWQSMADVRIALDELKQDADSGRLSSPAIPAPIVRRSAWLPAVAASIVAAAIAAFVVWHARPAAQPAELWHVTRLTNDTGVTVNPAISPDGKLVAYVSDRTSEAPELWVQQIEGGDPVQLTRGLGFCHDPAFSPDGSRIAVTCGQDPDAIYLVPTLGGLPRRVAEGEWAAFSPDGSQLAVSSPFVSVNGPQTIHIVPANGGDSRELKLDKTSTTRPIWRPDGKGLIVVADTWKPDGGYDYDWYFASAENGALTPTGAGDRLRAANFSQGRHLSVTTGGILFVQGTLDSTNIYRMPFDAAFQKAIGDPAPVIVGAGLSLTPSSSADGRRIAFAVATNPATNIYRAAIDPKTGAVSGVPTRVTNGLALSLMPSPSRDGTRIAYRAGSARAPEIRLRDFAANTDVRLAEAKDFSYLVLSADGSMVAFSSDQRAGSSIYVVPAAGGVPKKICTGCGRPVDWLPDRTKILIDNAGPKQHDIQMLDVASGQVTPLLQHPDEQLTMPRLSPDGRALSFTEVLPGRARRITLVPFTGQAVPQSEWSVVVDGSALDRQPAWSPAGDFIYFQSDRDGTRCIWAQRVDTGTRKAVGPPFAAHHIHQIRYYLDDVGDPAGVGLTIANGQMFFAAFELQSNVWMAEKPAEQSKN